MAASKEEQIYLKQVRYLQDEIERRKKSIAQKEKNVKLNRAKCAALEQDTKAIVEYLAFDLDKNQKRLKELQELSARQKEQSRLELEEIKEKNNQRLQEFRDELERKTTHMSDIEKKNAETLDDLEKQIQLRKDQLIEVQKQHEVKVKEIKEQTLDPEKVERDIKEAVDKVENSYKNKYYLLVLDERKHHKMWRDKLQFLSEHIVLLREERDTLSQRLRQHQENKNVNTEEQIVAENELLKQKVQKLRDRRKEMEREVREFKFYIEEQESKTKREVESLEYDSSPAHGPEIHRKQLFFLSVSRPVSLQSENVQDLHKLPTTKPGAGDGEGGAGGRTQQESGAGVGFEGGRHYIQAHHSGAENGSREVGTAALHFG
ncbi:hypothetical protein WMY93_004899 [Mugilogobius chulae]|uniref:Uncharacterized protein n=1 Tax=Mugilogobius chulae TaxID=88201 RepID=A0AAW0Q115_9GOBI